MSNKALNKKEKAAELNLRRLGSKLANRGIQLRREILSRGHAFKVKSGNCSVDGEGVIFIDKRLPVAQQTTLLIDLLLERGIGLEADELSLIPEAAKSLFAPSPN